LQRDGEIDSAVDVDAMLDLVWAVELGLGVLEALDVDLPKPGRWAQTVHRVMESFTSARQQP
jgi:hypothetical protein